MRGSLTANMGNPIPDRHREKRVLITGASTGIGRAAALRFAAEGADVAINFARSRSSAEAVLDECRRLSAATNRGNAEHLLIQADIGEEAEARGLVDAVLSDWGDLDILINNAGIQKQADSERHPMEDVRRVMDVNLLGALACSQTAIQHWLAREAIGTVVNCSSVHEAIPKPGYIGYSLSKGGLGNLTRTLALEYAERGIRVNAVAPGAIATPMNKQLKQESASGDRINARIPMRRMGSPHEIAAAFSFLASDDASYITGQTLYVCGGLTLFNEFKADWSA